MQPLSTELPSLFALLSGLVLSNLAAALSPQDIYVKASESIVVVKVLDNDDKPKQFGSGVALAPGEIVTNCHVLKDAHAIKVGRKGVFVEAVLLYRDNEHDLCLLIAPGIKAIPIQLGQTGNLRVGAPVYAIGSPKGLELSLSNGLVSQLRIDTEVPIIQTTAAISPGSSGGGLFDEEARLIGITSFYFKDGQNLNFAVPVDWIANLRSSQHFAWKTMVGAQECIASSDTEIPAPAPSTSEPEDDIGSVPVDPASNKEPEVIPVDASWSTVTETDDGSVYLRRSSIQKLTHQRVMAWYLFDYPSLQFNKDKDEYYWSVLLRYLFDCDVRKLALLSRLEKSAPAGTGEVIETLDFEDHEIKFRHAVPDSIGEAMLEAACN